MGQTRLLARTFFTRLFESDLMPDGLPQVQLVVWGAILANAPTSAYAFIVADKYAFIQFTQSLAQEFAADRTVLITLSMMIVGVVGLVIWDGVFPDRRDARVLGCLPIPTRRFVVARLTALAEVYVFFAAPMCLLQSVLFPLLVAGHGDAVPRVLAIAAHLASVTLACTFVFAALIAAQCVLLVAFGRRVSQHVSTAFQLLFAVGLVQLLVFLPDVGRILRQGGQEHEGLRALAALPPLWFLGLYETLTGTGGAAATALARTAVAATAATVIGAGVLYAATYDTLAKRALEGAPVRRTRGDRVAGLLRALASPRWIAPARLAIRQFTVRTFARSRHHRMMLAIYAGIALAIVVSSAVSVAVRNPTPGISPPGIALLSMPLIFQFLILIGIRVIVAIPVEPRARWVFRACEPAASHTALSGVRDTMLLVVVLPTVIFAFAQGAVFWGAGAAFRHALFSGALGTLFTEALLIGLDKLPFACTYFPGKSRVFTLWPLYIATFFIYTGFFAVIDHLLLDKPFGNSVFSAAVFIAAAALAYRRRRLTAMLPGLRFEEEDPDRMFQGFNLSEAMAAAPKPIVPDQHATTR